MCITLIMDDDDDILLDIYRTAQKEHPTGYDIWGACCLELELDVLTGQYMVRLHSHPHIKDTFRYYTHTHKLNINYCYQTKLN